MKDKQIELFQVSRAHPALLAMMQIHYSKPNGFVGRNICYGISYDKTCYGFIVAGSAVKNLSIRDLFFRNTHLDNLVNNIFYHIEKVDGLYPIRNFTTKVIQVFRETIIKDWPEKYDGDKVLGFETLVELPRTGECYLRDGWKLLGQTKGFTCKRIAGESTDSWSGKRVWNTTDLRPKHILVREL